MFFFKFLVITVRQYAHARAQLLYGFPNVQGAKIANGLLDAEIEWWEGTRAFIRGFRLAGEM